MPVRRCPICSLVNPGTAQTCDCGFSFETGQRGAPRVIGKPTAGGTAGGAFAERVAMRVVIRVVAILVVASVLAGLRACGA